MKRGLLIVLFILTCIVIGYADLWHRDPSGNYQLKKRVEIDDTTFRTIITAKPFLHDVAEGLVPDYSCINTIGLSDSIVTSLDDVTEIDIKILLVPGGSNDSARIVEMVSTSDADSIGNAGSRSIRIDGLDSLWNEQADTVILKGTVPVNTTKTWLRINDLYVITHGTYGETSTGTITVRDTSGTEEYNRITAGGNKSFQCFFTVPEGKTAYIVGWFPGVAGGVGGTDVYQIILRATCTAKERLLMPGIFLFQDNAVIGNNSTFRWFETPIRVPEHADIKVSARRLTGNKVGKVTADISMYLRDN